MSTRFRHIAGPLRSVNAFLLGVVLCLTSTVHLNNPFLFLASVERYRIVSSEFTEWVAAAFMFLGLVIGSALIVGIWTRAAFIGASLIFSCFLLAQALVLMFGLQVDCGCFGSLSLAIGWKSITFVVCCLASAIVGAYFAKEDLVPSARQMNRQKKWRD
jgi:uncharacterized membrane protein